MALESIQIAFAKCVWARLNARRFLTQVVVSQCDLCFKKIAVQWRLFERQRKTHHERTSESDDVWQHVTVPTGSLVMGLSDGRCAGCLFSNEERALPYG